MSAPSTFTGIAASPGVVIGRVYLLDRRKLAIRRYHIEPDQTDYETERLRSAIAAAVTQLESIRVRFVGGEVDHHAILEAHEMMLRDESILLKAQRHINAELCNAEWAVQKVIAHLRELFASAEDPYFRERKTDIDFLGERILRSLTGQSGEIADIDDLSGGSIIVAWDLSPIDTALLSKHKVTAFVTEIGGRTSHTSIIARSIDVPAVVAAHGVFDAVGHGDKIIVDGLSGTVTIRPSSKQILRAKNRAENYRRYQLDLLEAKALPATTVDGMRIAVNGNIELPAEAENVLSHGGEGIGLYRTEFMFVGRKEPPGEEDHYRNYCRIFDEVDDLPVTIRTLDLGGDKLFGNHEEEANPALGLRAIRYCLQEPKIFEDQLAGLLRAGTRGDLRIMFPMISGLDEVRMARAALERVKRRLTRDKKDHRSNVKVGIMIEVPSAVIQARALAREVDFFSIGTNDLMQYLLAIDRMNDRVAYLYDPLHPAMLKVLSDVKGAANAAGIPVSLCGEMAGDPEHLPVLVGMGFEELSANAGSIPQVKRLIRELNAAECADMVEEALSFDTVAEVRQLVGEFMAEKMPPTDDDWSDDDPDTGIAGEDDSLWT